MIEAGANVLVTGATGFTGSALTRRLCEIGCNVRAIARDSSDRASLSDLRLQWFIGDVYDRSVIDEAVDSVDYVFHVAAAFRTAGISDDVYRKVHVDSTRELAEAVVEKAVGLKRFVHFSTMGVHGHIENPPADESTPFSPGDVYQETKLKGERVIVEFADEHDIPLTVIRPTAILGPGDKRLLKLFKLAKLPLVPIIGGGKGLYHLIHVDDLVSFAIHAAGSDEAISEVFICGNEEPISIQEIVSVVGAKFGRNPRFIRIPAAPVFLVARICENVCKKLGVEPPIYERRVAFFTKDRAFDTSKMRNLPGFALKYDNHSGIRQTCNAYQESGML